jgi:hypothetical protein
MKFQAAALCLLLASTSDPASAFNVVRPQTSFIPKHNLLMNSPGFVGRQSVSTKATLTMFAETSGGMEELENMSTNTNGKNPAAGIFRKSPKLWKIASLASIPLSAALGFGIVPSRRIAAHTVGALVTGIAGAVGKSRMDASLLDSCSKPVIAEALLSGADGGYLKNPKETAQVVKQVQSEYGFDDEDFDTLCTEIYTQFLLGMVKFQFQPKTGDLKELDAIKIALGLDNLQVGEAHANAAQEWFRSTCRETPEEDLEDPENPDRMAMDKLLFLTERSLRQGGETQEAFVFEMTRVAKAMHLDYQTALERVAEVIEPFYLRALKSTREKLDSSQVNSGMLERARQTLGVSDTISRDMHVACFNEEVKALLGKTEDIDENDEEADPPAVDLADQKFPDGAMERVRTFFFHFYLVLLERPGCSPSLFFFFF